MPNLQLPRFLQVYQRSSLPMGQSKEEPRSILRALDSALKLLKILLKLDPIHAFYQLKVQDKMDFHVKLHEPLTQLNVGAFLYQFKSKELLKLHVHQVLANFTMITTRLHSQNKFSQEQPLETNKFQFGENTESQTLEINVLMDKDKSEIYLLMTSFVQLLMLFNKILLMLITEIISDVKPSKINKLDNIPLLNISILDMLNTV